MSAEVCACVRACMFYAWYVWCVVSYEKCDFFFHLEYFVVVFFLFLFMVLSVTWYIRDVSCRLDARNFHRLIKRWMTVSNGRLLHPLPNWNRSMSLIR